MGRRRSRALQPGGEREGPGRAIRLSRDIRASALEPRQGTAIPLNDALREYAGSKKRQRLLFTLRKVDATDLISNAGDSAAMAERGPGKEPVLADANLSELFALEMAAERESAAGATVADRKPSARGVTPSKKSTKEKLDRKTTSARQKAVRSTRTSTERQAAVMGLGPRSPSGR